MFWVAAGTLIWPPSCSFRLARDASRPVVCAWRLGCRTGVPCRRQGIVSTRAPVERRQGHFDDGLGRAGKPLVASWPAHNTYYTHLGVESRRFVSKLWKRPQTQIAPIFFGGPSWGHPISPPGGRHVLGKLRYSHGEEDRRSLSVRRWPPGVLHFLILAGYSQQAFSVSQSAAGARGFCLVIQRTAACWRWS